MHPCAGRSAASPMPARPCATAGRAKGPMPTSPRQARARTGTSGQSCAVAAALRASGHPAAPISLRLPAQCERTVVGSTLPCRSRVAAAPTADGASCLAGPRSNRARSGTKHSPAPGDRPSPAPRDRAPASCRTAEPPFGAAVMALALPREGAPTWMFCRLTCPAHSGWIDSRAQPGPGGPLTGEQRLRRR